MEAIARELDLLARRDAFSGAVRVDRGETTELERAYGLAHRGFGVPNDVTTRFGIASGTKGLTAMTTLTLVEERVVQLDTPARSLLGRDLPLVAADVTIEQLLSHRSGIGDYYDEEIAPEPEEFALPVPVTELETTEDYIVVLDGQPPKFAPGERFSYCNSGYVLLALLAERATGTPFHELVRSRLCEPAGMTDTGFFRSDELPARTAVGYLDAGMRTNVFHLPVRGTGDGGIYSTVRDLGAFWRALFEGKIVSEGWVREAVRPRSEGLSQGRSYGLGFWLEPTNESVLLEGYDAGVSFRSVHDPRRDLTYTVVSNTTRGAWPVARLLRDALQA